MTPTPFKTIRLAGTFALVATIGSLFIACQKKSDMIHEQKAASIDEYIHSLQYNPQAILNVQSISSGSIENKQTSQTTDDSYSAGYNTACITKHYSLRENFTDVAILRPTNGVIYPGALVVGDASMLSGNPTPLSIDRAPVKLRLDLPGIGDAGNIKVDQPDNSNVNAKIDNALQYWNDHAYQEGYVNPLYVSYNTATSYSSKQLALSLGLNVEWASGDMATQFNYTSTTVKKVAMMVFRQGFYSVTMEAPAAPSDVFGKKASLEKVQSVINNQVPPAYVHSVVYGRLVMFRMESTYTSSASELELALQYATGVTQVQGDAEVRIKNVLANSSTTLILVGGNSEVETEGVSPTKFADLKEILKGRNAVYSKSNPGVPIAYTIRYLKDNSFAKMGYTTDYSVQECSKKEVPGARLRLYNGGWYDVRFYVDYTDKNGKPKSGGSKKLNLDMEDTYDLPAGAHDITFTVKYSNGSSYKTLKTYNYTIPSKHCYQTSGTVFSPSVKTVTCN